MYRPTRAESSCRIEAVGVTWRLSPGHNVGTPKLDHDIDETEFISCKCYQLRPITCTISSSVFTARCTTVQSAVLRLHVVCLSVLCKRWWSGSRKLEILETNCTDNQPNIFALRRLEATHLLAGEHGEILGRLEVGWGKVACWSTKAGISLKHVKTDEKLL